VLDYHLNYLARGRASRLPPITSALKALVGIEGCATDGVVAMPSLVAKATKHDPMDSIRVFSRALDAGMMGQDEDAKAAVQGALDSLFPDGIGHRRPYVTRPSPCERCWAA
jgi:hypothetical protein